MAEGVEQVSNLITRYTIFETTYLRATYTTDVNDEFCKSLVKLYKIVLEYLCKAQKYYGHNTVGMCTDFDLFSVLAHVLSLNIVRTIKSAFKSAESMVNTYFTSIANEQAQVDKWAMIVDAQRELYYSLLYN